MAKNLLKFETEVDYRTAKRNNLIVPNISIIKESGDVHINGTIVPRNAAEAGDIIAYDTDMNKHFIKPEAFNHEMASKYTPVSVVVIPSLHTEDGMVIGMSLGAMSLSNASTGVNTNEEIRWGNSISELDGYDCVVTVSPENIGNAAPSIEASERSRLPSDIFFDVNNSISNPIDTYTKWASGTQMFTPSAYDKKLGKNSIYSTDSLLTNCLQDANGQVNLPSTVTVDNAAIYACHNYSYLPYKNAGSWYLPSIGELGYLILRYSRIQYAIAQVKQYNKGHLSVALLPDEATFWSSTQSSDKTKVWCVNSLDGAISKFNNTTGNFVRAFAKF